MKKIIYLSGAISGCPNFYEHFANAEKLKKEEGYIVLNPALFPAGLTQKQYMFLSMSYLSLADEVYALNNYVESEGALVEVAYAKKCGLPVYYEEKK